MDRMLRDGLDRLQKKLQSDAWRARLDHPEVYHNFRHWLRDSERWIDEGGRWPLHLSDDREALGRLREIEEKLDDLLHRPARCNAPSDFKQQFPSFMTSLTAINDGNLAVARSKFRSHQAGWLANVNRCVIADPYIFKSGAQSPDEYAAGLGEIVGAQVERVDFYFSSEANSYSINVATKVFNVLQQAYQGPPGKKRKIVFYAYADLHDRVWLRHSSVGDNPPHLGWDARVIGASVNGVRARPTYIVDMDDDDANDYSKYLKNIRNVLSSEAVTLAPPT
jgi:hypothetical protein